MATATREPREPRRPPRLTDGEVAALIARRDWEAVRDALTELPAPEVIDWLQRLRPAERLVLFRLLPRDVGSAVFSYLGSQEQNALLSHLTDDETRHLLATLRPDARTHLLEELPGEATQKLLNLLDEEDLKEAHQLLGYPAESVGRLMTPDYVAVRPEWTVERALLHVRERGHDSETVDEIYVTDDTWYLLDALPLRRLILAEPAQTVEDLMDHHYTVLLASEDREQAVHTMQRYRLSVLPVVDSDGVLVGIVTADDVLNVAEAEATEDIHRIGGVEPVGIDYAQAGVMQLWRKRIGWLLILLAADFMTSSVIAFYEGAIEAVVALAYFIPMLIDTGGNTGTQSATLVIRGLATGKLNVGDWLRVLWKELRVGILLGAALGTAVYLRGFVWRGGPEVGLVVGLTMVVLVIWANVVGAVLPMVISRLRLDPAVVSSPFITTTVDVTGLVIYFTIATIVLGI